MASSEPGNVPRYLVTARRGSPPSESRPSALDAVRQHPGVTVVTSANADMVTIEASPGTADALKDKLKDHFFVEPEVRRNPLDEQGVEGK
jgi:hypothetical protein